MWLRFWWDRVEGTYLDDKFVERKWEAGHGQWFEIKDHLVELEGRDGQPVRLTIRDRSLFLRLPPRGSRVPLRANRRRTKAAFDREGTSIDPSASLDEHDEARRAADEARWDATWGTRPGSSADA